MVRVLTADEMRKVEQRAIDARCATGLQLMETAGAAVVDEIDLRWLRTRDEGETVFPGPKSRQVLVLCGPGNNGGDGFVVARLIAESGVQVHVYLFGEQGRLPPDARTNLERWEHIGLVNDMASLRDHIDEVVVRDRTIVVDSLFGTGMSRPLGNELHETLMAIKKRKPLAMVAVDLPSGVCSDSGRRMNDLPTYDLTVTFHTAKPGHFLADGPEVCGEVVVRSIGLEEREDEGSLLATGTTLNLLATLRKNSLHHKYDHGHSVIIAGPAGQGGAARLAARGALRTGSGLVTVVCPERAQGEMAGSLDAIMVRAVRGLSDLKRIVSERRINAICMGPGLGPNPATRRQVQAILETEQATVLDADALSAWQHHSDDLIGMLHERVVITPHLGEFDRLFPDLAVKLREAPKHWPAFSKIDAVAEASKHCGCTVLLKGPDTVVASPGRPVIIHSATHETSTAWLATAGSGDVLAGMICGLLARGLNTLQAAATATFLHARAAVECGPGLIAEDLPEQLPGVFRDIGV